MIFSEPLNNEAGEDLSWFWKEWFYNNWQLDLGVQSVSYPKKDSKANVNITIVNLQKMAMPCMVEIVLKDGSKQNIELPVEAWLQSDTHILHLQIPREIQSVTIDPQHLLPDSNRKNNVWKE